jgi:arylsulfatase A-like enzyme
MGRRMTARLLLPLLVLAVAGSCARTADERRNVVLIVVDSVRADRLSIFGHERPLPGLEELARRGTSFRRAYATAPWTKPSVGSMLTGLHPTSHGATNAASLLDRSVETLPEMLAAEGYATVGVVSHHLIGKKFRFDQGFDEWDQASARGHKFVSSEEITRRSARALRDLAEGDAPFFLLAHYFDPHYDYRDHDGVHYAAPSAGRLDGSHGIGRLRKMMADVTPEELAFLLDRYDEEIRFTDRWIGRLLRRLDELGLAEDTVVAFTVDHGEEFGERGWLGHMRTLYDELMRVPLVLRGPGVPAGLEVERPVSLVDLAPTLLDLAGVGAGSRELDGTSLAPLLRGDPGPEDVPVFLEVDYLGVEIGIPGLKTTRKKGVVLGDLKLVRDDRSGEIELYDLASDPLERRDLAEERPERARELLAVLERHLAALSGRARAAEETAFTPEELSDLRDLGYAGDE